MDKQMKMHLPILSFNIHIMCEKVLGYFQSIFKKFSEGAVTTLSDAV